MMDCWLEDSNPLYLREGRIAWEFGQEVGREHHAEGSVIGDMV